MRSAVIVVAATLLAFAAARCPNSCSGHGDCGSSDVCACWPNWQGFDCSERTCEYDIAWATDARQNPHYYAECSGKGICDRTTGLCACFDGYTGSACRRSVCPNDCSGHGKCRLVSELPNANQAHAFIDSVTYTAGGNSFTDNFNKEGAGVALPYQRWDGDKIQACECDGGFFGPDCSQRYCPKGDDPLTTCTETIPLYPSTTKQIQELVLSSTATASITDTDSAITLTSDTIDAAYGSVAGDACDLTAGDFTVTVDGHTTSAITWAAAATLATSVQTAIRALATNAATAYLSTVTVSGAAFTQVLSGNAADAGSFTNGVRLTITFPGRFGAHTVSATAGTLTVTNCGGVTPSSVDFTVAGTQGGYTDALGSIFNAAGDLVLHFTDNQGGLWTTSRIPNILTGNTASTIGDAIETALAGIPNFKVPAVTATGAAEDTTGAVRSIAIQVTFDSERVSGNQNLLSCDPLPLGCQSAGCQPKYNQPIKITSTQVAGSTGTDAAVLADKSGSAPAITFTSDSVFDNSGLSVDQAQLTVTFRWGGSTNEIVYSAVWTVSGSLTAPTLDGTGYTNVRAPTCTSSSGAFCSFGYIPVRSTSDVGVGYTHIPVGYGMYISAGYTNAFFTGLTAADDVYSYTWTVATIRCAVTEVQSSDPSVEDFECSGRGVCDHSSGTCTCFEGHYGDHCGLQTILV